MNILSYWPEALLLACAIFNLRTANELRKIGRFQWSLLTSLCSILMFLAASGLFIAKMIP